MLVLMSMLMSHTLLYSFVLSFVLACSCACVASRELNKQATFLSTRTAAGSKLHRYKWRMMASAVLV